MYLLCFVVALSFCVGDSLINQRCVFSNLRSFKNQRRVSGCVFWLVFFDCINFTSVGHDCGQFTKLR
ncbi:Uncharacterised protein [Vibrio cholerae]|nr:Uncharacterised protein [Vibrio cholerae]